MQVHVTNSKSVCDTFSKCKIIDSTEKEILQFPWMCYKYPDGEKYWFVNIPEGYELNRLTPEQYIIELLLTKFDQELEEMHGLRDELQFS